MAALSETRLNEIALNVGSLSGYILKTTPDDTEEGRKLRNTAVLDLFDLFGELDRLRHVEKSYRDLTETLIGAI